MHMYISDKWIDYEILDAGGGEKLERWGDIIVVRPDPQIIWPRMNESIWQKRHMHYHRSKSGGGSWEFADGKALSGGYRTIKYKNAVFNIKPTDFKHMGLFPEQAANWDWTTDTIKKSGRKIRILNLFGYTGGATVSCMLAGADVTHVDAAKGMNRWAKDNIKSSGMEKSPCRVITDDVFKFVQREKRRGSFYDGILLDPPSYGRGPSGEIWKLENRLYDLLHCCIDILSKQPQFILLNTYTTGFTAAAAENVLKYALNNKNRQAANISSGSLGLPIKDSNLILPCGTTCRCVF